MTAVATVVLAGLLTMAPASAVVAFPTIRPFTVDRSPTSLSVAWDAPEGSELFRVQVSRYSSMKSATYHEFSADHGTITGLRPDTVYYLRVAILDPATRSRLSSYTPTPYATAVTTATSFPRGYPAPIPDTPRAVAATATTVGLDWADLPQAGAYRIQYSTASSMKGAKYLEVPGSQGTLTGLKAGATYYVRVTAMTAVGGSRISDYTAKPYGVASTEAAGTSDVRVGSFNVSGVNNDVGRSVDDPRTWISRRGAVAGDIVGSGLDVVGLQEANQSLMYNDVEGVDYLPAGSTQYLDLVAALGDAGQSWEVTAEAPYNCADQYRSSPCDPVDRGAAHGTRIIYRTDRLTLVDSGSVRFDRQYVDPEGVPDHDRYMAWAELEVKDSGRRFFFVTAHLTWRAKSVRQAQWQQVIDETKARRHGLPVVVTGDLNFSKFDTQTKTMLPAMKSAGFGDVLGQTYGRTTSSGMRARTVVRAWMNSFHGMVRDLDGNGRCYCSSQSKIGNNIDWIFASNQLVVKRWETVMDVDRAFDQIGVIRSDHHLVTATIALK